MTQIRNVQEFVDSLRNFETWLPTEVSGASDVDGMIERGGEFLFLEQKKYGERMSGGQQRALRELAKKPGIQVLVVYGPDPGGEYLIRSLSGRGLKGDINTLRGVALQWWNHPEDMVP